MPRWHPPFSLPRVLAYSLDGGDGAAAGLRECHGAARVCSRCQGRGPAPGIGGGRSREERRVPARDLDHGFGACNRPGQLHLTAVLSLSNRLGTFHTYVRDVPGSRRSNLAVSRVHRERSSPPPVCPGTHHSLQCPWSRRANRPGIRQSHSFIDQVGYRLYFVAGLPPADVEPEATVLCSPYILSMDERAGLSGVLEVGSSRPHFACDGIE